MTKEDTSFKESAVKRILIVDDDRGLGELLNGFFKKAGFQSNHAAKGKEGIETFKEMRPHLVLLDLLLPDLNGFDVLKRMKEPPWSENVHFIVMSGVMKDPGMAAKAKSEHGAHDFIAKPFKVRELHNTILSHLGMDTIPEDEENADHSPEKPTSNKPPIIPEPSVTIEGGKIGEVDLPRIISAFFTGKVSGVLKISHQDTVKAIYFENGKPIFAASKDPRDRIGEISVRLGKVTQSQVDEALKQSNDASRLGTTLINLGYLKPHDLYELVQTQVKEIILSCFEWREGVYAFHFEDLAGREMIKLQTSPANLVLEGIYRYYPDEYLDKRLQSRKRVFKKSSNPDFLFQNLQLGSSEMRIFDIINGRRNLEKVIELAKLPEKNILQLIYALLAMKIIEDKA